MEIHSTFTYSLILKCGLVQGLSYIRPDNHALANREFFKLTSSQALLPHQRSLTYTQELLVLVGHTESSLTVDFARGGVKVAPLREWGQKGNAVRQPETLSVVKEQHPCRMRTNNCPCFFSDAHECQTQWILLSKFIKVMLGQLINQGRWQLSDVCPFLVSLTPKPYWSVLFKIIAQQHRHITRSFNVKIRLYTLYCMLPDNTHCLFDIMTVIF